MQYKARITKISRHAIAVRFTATSGGCSSCGLSGSCCGGPKAEVAIPSGAVTVPVADTSDLRVGQAVMVETAGRSYAIAVLWSFIIPVALLILSVIICGDSADPTLGAAVGLVAVAAYFLILKLFRHRFAATVRWRLAGPCNCSDT